jgi:hypothetical protein
MRDTIVPAPDIHGLIVRERRLTLITGLVVMAIIAAAGGFMWNTMLALEDAERRTATADSEVTAAHADAEAARLGAMSPNSMKAGRGSPRARRRSIAQRTSCCEPIRP